jgi:hypothetical protein
MVQGDLAPGIHRVRVAHATPNRLYCQPMAQGVGAEDAEARPGGKARELRVISPPLF